MAALVDSDPQVNAQRRYAIAERYAAERDQVHGYLTSPSPPRRCPLGPPWKRLRARLHRDAADRDRLIGELYSLFKTGWYWTQSDDQEGENRRRATEALPTGRRAKALTEDWTKWFVSDLSHFSASERAAVLRQKVLEAPFETTTGEGMKAIVTVQDLVEDERGRSKLRPGSGRREEQDTASEELMKFLVDGLGLSALAAVQVTADVNLWFWGRAVEPAALGKRMQRQPAP